MNSEHIPQSELANIIYDTLAKNTNNRQLPLEWIVDIDNNRDIITLDVYGHVYELILRSTYNKI